MKHTALISTLSLFALTVCVDSAAQEPTVPPANKSYMPIVPGAALPPGHPSTEVEKMETGTVVSTLDVSGFTYIEIQQGHDTRWIATGTTDVKKGEVIEFESSPPVENFKSKKLNRTFPSVSFVNSVTVVKGK